jgi:hypothetical protein
MSTHSQQATVTTLRNAEFEGDSWCAMERAQTRLAEHPFGEQLLPMYMLHV